jgi:ABC-type dipeptide/oligopeptide/nickel transport system ATPase component/ABC-type dipeptide/oligopeptide/nickel transport system permease subunit
MWVALGWVALLLLASWWVDANTVNASALDQIRLSASIEHPFGTDELGRDIFLRTVASSGLTLWTAIASTTIGVLGGILLGSVAAATRGRVRSALGSSIAGLVAVPPLLFAIFVSAVIGIGAVGAVVGVGLAQIPSMARLTQTLVASVSQRDYVDASRLLGLSRLIVFSRHVLPHVMPPLAIHSALVLGLSLVAVSTLSFLGVGLQLPDYDWGVLVSKGQPFIFTNPLAAVGPGLFVIITGIVFASVGETFARAAPRRKVTEDAEVIAEGPVGQTKLPHMAQPVAVARNLSVCFDTGSTVVEAVRCVDLIVPAGARVGLVGESGSGKTLTARALSGLLPPQARILTGSVEMGGIDVTDTSRVDHHQLAGACAVVFQDPLTALNPSMRIGAQMIEGPRRHQGMGRKEALVLAARTLEAVQITEPELVLRLYPHQLSGGMRQRVCIATALMLRPSLIIADEPTTALDTVVQAEVLAVLDQVIEATATALLLISHDLAVVASLCEQIHVMRDGVIVESGAKDDIINRPQHPYTEALLAAQPSMGQNRRRERLGHV